VLGLNTTGAADSPALAALVVPAPTTSCATGRPSGSIASATVGSTPIVALPFPISSVEPSAAPSAPAAPAAPSAAPSAPPSLPDAKAAAAAAVAAAGRAPVALSVYSAGCGAVTAAPVTATLVRPVRSAPPGADALPAAANLAAWPAHAAGQSGLVRAAKLGPIELYNKENADSPRRRESASPVVKVLTPSGISPCRQKAHSLNRHATDFEAALAIQALFAGAGPE